MSFLKLQDNPAGVKELPSAAALLAFVVSYKDLAGKEGLEQEWREVHLDVVRCYEDIGFGGRDPLERKAHAQRGCRLKEYPASLQNQITF